MPRSATAPDTDTGTVSAPAGAFVARDWTDFRDLDFRPPLLVLPDALAPQGQAPDGWPGFEIRDQKHTPHCTGHALAQLVDLQRRAHRQTYGLTPLAVDDVVSADMLYWMAALHDQFPDHPPHGAGMAVPGRGVRSLRSLLKAFYHHGVCPDHPDRATTPPDASWQSACYGGAGTEPLSLLPTVAQAKAARAVSLGAYYRLAGRLNDYHAALQATGSVLVSAEIHDGWNAPFGAETRIGKGQGPTGSHAFVIVGYDETGFLVLNSWGKAWGGHAGLAGVAHWDYRDWAGTVIDGWVLRLAVPAPGAFDLTIGAQGLARSMGTIDTASPRGQQLLGHYLHLDDGFHVDQGALPSDRLSWPRTRVHLAATLNRPAAPQDARPPRKGVLLWIGGAFQRVETAAQAAIRRKAPIRELGLYPYSLFWCNQVIETALEVLDPILEGCAAQAGAPGPALDALIERRLRGIGRAVWREIELSARRAVHGVTELPDDAGPRAGAPEPGPASFLFRDMLDMAGEGECTLHLVCEGAGVLVLHELLAQAARMGGPGPAQVASRLASLALLHPGIDLRRTRDHVLPLVAAMNAKADRQAPRALILHPAPALERRLCFGRYGGPLLQLVARSFEDRLAPPRSRGTDQPTTHPSQPPRVFLGTSAARGAPALRAFGPPLRGAFHAIRDIAGPPGPVSYAALVDDRQAETVIFDLIRSLG